MLSKEFKYFIDNQNELVKKYNNRVIVIIGEEIVGNYDSFGQAFFESSKKYEAGTFLIQECLPGEEAYTQRFHSRAIFA